MCRKPIGHGLFLRCLLGDAGGDACVGIGLDFLLRMTGFVIPGGMQWSVGIFPLFSQCDPAGRRPAMCGRKRMIIIAHSAQLSPHCTGGGIRSDGGSSARSGRAKQRSLLCPLSERGWRHPLLFAVLDLLVLLDQAKSTEEKNTRQKKSILRKEFRRQDRLRRICGPKAVGHAHGGGPPQAEASTRTAQRSAIFQAGLWGFARPKPGLHGTLLREFPKSSFKQEISARPAPFRPARRPPR